MNLWYVVLIGGLAFWVGFRIGVDSPRERKPKDSRLANVDAFSSDLYRDVASFIIRGHESGLIDDPDYNAVLDKRKHLLTEVRAYRAGLEARIGRERNNHE